MVNPWIYYILNEPKRIPDLNPHDKNEARGCIGGVIGFIAASIIFVLLQYFTLKIKLLDYINRDIYFLLVLLNVIVYVILTIVFMKISFKITDRMNSKRVMGIIESRYELIDELYNVIQNKVQGRGQSFWFGYAESYVDALGIAEREYNSSCFLNKWIRRKRLVQAVKNIEVLLKHFKQDYDKRTD